MNKYDYWREPDSGLYRIRQSIDGGNNRRIVGHVVREDEAKLIVAALSSRDEKSKER